MTLQVVLRQFTRQPLLASAPIVILSLGIASIVSVQLIFNPMLFQPLPGIADPARVVRIDLRDAASGGWSSLSTFSEFRQLRAEATTTVREIAGGWFSSQTPVMRRTGAGATVTVGLVTRGYFDVLGVVPRLGRLFTRDEAEAPGIRLVVISEHLWETLYGRGASALGDQLLINGDAYTVIGVTSRFRGLNHLWHTDLWLPFTAWPTFGQALDRPPSVLIARQRPGSTLGAVDKEVRSIVSGFKSERRLKDTLLVPVLSPGITEEQEQSIRTRLARMCGLLFLAAIVLFLVACANAANLVMARQLNASLALQVRAALGATRRRLFMELLGESATIALASGILGVAAAVAVTRAFAGVAILAGLSSFEPGLPDWRVVSVAILTVVWALGIVGFAPAAVASGVATHYHARGWAGRRAPKTHPMKNVLIGCQVALALALMATMGVLQRTVSDLRTAVSGFDPSGVLQVSFERTRPQNTLPDGRDVYVRVVEQINSLAGAGHCAYAEWTLSPGYVGESVEGPDGARIKVHVNVVSEEYFRTLNIPLLAGRTFNRDEVQLNQGQGNADVIIVSERLAKRLFSDGTGARHIRLRHRPRIVDGRLVPPLPEEVDVVGVVGEARLEDVRKDPVMTVYRPGQPDWGRLLVRLGSADAQSAAQLLQRTVAHSSAKVVATVTPLQQLLDERIREELVLVKVSSIAGTLAVLLACLGVSSVVTFLVASRKREITVRRVLGASLLRALSAELTHPMYACGWGLLSGLVLFVFSSKLLASRVYGISVLDTQTLVVATLAMGVIAVIAAWLPAVAGARGDLATFLRCE